MEKVNPREVARAIRCLIRCEAYSMSDCASKKCRYFSQCMDCSDRVLADACNLLSAMPENVDLRNCVNCNHYDVCTTVYFRKVNKANDYSPCGHWEEKRVTDGVNPCGR